MGAEPLDATHSLALIDEIKVPLSGIFIKLDFVDWFQLTMEEWDSFDFPPTLMAEMKLLDVFLKLDCISECLWFIFLDAGPFPVAVEWAVRAG